MSDKVTNVKRYLGGAVESGTDLPPIPAVPHSKDASVTNFMQSVKTWIERAAGKIQGEGATPAVVYASSSQDLNLPGLSGDPAWQDLCTASISVAQGDRVSIACSLWVSTNTAGAGALVRVVRGSEPIYGDEGDFGVMCGTTGQKYLGSFTIGDTAKSAATMTYTLQVASNSASPTTVGVGGGRIVLSR